MATQADETFEYTVRPTCLTQYVFSLGKRFCEKNGLKENTTVELTVKGLHEYKWLARFLYQDGNGTSSSNSKPRIRRLLSFLKNFLADSQAKVGDKLIFRHLGNSLKTKCPRLQVEIIHCNFPPSLLLEVQDDVYKVGDCIRICADGQSEEELPDIARIEEIPPGKQGKNMKVNVRWFFHPEEIRRERSPFLGAKELFVSDLFTTKTIGSIERKCSVHTLETYMTLDSIGADDYVCRFEFNTTTGDITPEKTEVFCTCETPRNPDHLMIYCDTCRIWFHPYCFRKVQCETCKDWFHSDCTVYHGTGGVINNANYFCEDCSLSDGDIGGRA